MREQRAIQARSHRVCTPARRAAPRPLCPCSNLRGESDPNYFGETLFWTSLGLLGAAAGQPWVLCGAAFNTLVLISVTFMTEGRMLARPERRAEYERYIRTTSSWIPRAKFTDNKRK
jgi:steroid 5-alpha reductase family enzyme